MLRRKPKLYKPTNKQSVFTADFFTKEVAGGARELKKSIQQGGLKGGAKAIGEGLKNIGTSLLSELPRSTNHRKRRG